MKGKTAYVKGADEPQSGTLELTGNATDVYVYPGKTYYSTDPKTKRTGTMPTQAAITITPGASQQIAVAAGRYVTGDVIVPGFALPAANQIKKGVTVNIYGRTVTGTFEGWVPVPTDIFYNGVFTSGASCRTFCIISNTWIYHNSSANNLTINLGARNVSGFSKLNIYGAITPYNSSDRTSIIELHNYSGVYNKVTINVEQNVWKTWNIDISQISAFNSDGYLMIDDISKGSYSDITAHTRISHIWLS